MKANRLLLSMIWGGMCVTAHAQKAGKLSASTRLLLMEHRMGTDITNVKSNACRAFYSDENLMVPAFIALATNNYEELRKHGAVVDKCFDGLVTASIPVDSIEAIASLDNVRKIEIAETIEPQTDVVRSLTRAEDVLTYSDVAKESGLARSYDGAGVIVGIIDQGIDFQHSAFKDENGQSRICRAYTVNEDLSTLRTYYTADEIGTLTTDNSATSHGTHTTSIAAGSEIAINGTIYGGMAPRADLVVAALSTFTTVGIGNAIKAITDYADSIGKPSVISLSIATSTGPRDGTGSLAKIIEQCVGKGHIIVYASSNAAGRSDEGGVYLHGAASRKSPLMTILRSHRYSNTNDSYRYDLTADIWARTPEIPLAVRFYVINKSSGSRLWESEKLTADVSVSSLSGFSNYYTGKDFSVVFTQDPDNKKCNVRVTMEKMVTTKTSTTNCPYEIGIKVFPDVDDTSYSTEVDGWMKGSYGYYAANQAGTWTFIAGSDSCSVSDEAANPNVIAVGAYVSKNSVTDYMGTKHDFSSRFPTVGDYASYSSWSAEGYGPLGVALPTVVAPGSYIISAVNHYDEDYMTDEDIRVNSDEKNPYGAMSGTSMAAPCVSGIIALWLQACPELTPDMVKIIITATAQHDSHTDGSDYAHFGNGKIDALSGLAYIQENLSNTLRSGDVNRDGSVTIADVTALVNIILGKDSAEPHQYDHAAADVNGDGSITIADVTALVNVILGK